MSRRPETQAPPEIFYNEGEAAKYATNSRMREIQGRMSKRALELLCLPSGQPSILLDIGCGSGISGEVMGEEGHFWVGLDISEAMLGVAIEQDALDSGDMLMADVGDLQRFRPGSFDGAISISAIQWLCNADKKHHEPYKRLSCFFRWLYESLQQGSRAVFQFYPENARQVEMITSAAMRNGFNGGLVVDFPNSTRAKKHYLCIWAGLSSAPAQQLPQGLQAEEEEEDGPRHIASEGRERVREKKKRKINARPAFKSKDWIRMKKVQQEIQGKRVRLDSKYTGRKRKGRL